MIKEGDRVRHIYNSKMGEVFDLRKRNGVEFAGWIRDEDNTETESPICNLELIEEEEEMRELVFVNNNNEVVTDSLMVAEVFGKRHDNVMRDIKNQIDKLKEAGEVDFYVLNFEGVGYHDSKNEYRNKYNLTEDAFAMIAMSYVTVEAMRMKVKFINEFKKMKEHIKKQESAPLKPIDQIRLLMANSLETEERLATVETNVEKLQNTMTIDYGQQVVLDNAKKKRVEYLWENLKVKGIHDTKRKLYAQFGKDLKRAFAVPSYRDISAKDFEEAMKFTKGWRPHLV